MKRKMFTHLLKSMFILLLVFGVGKSGWGQVSITALGSAVTQNFNNLSTSGTSDWVQNSTLVGWYSATALTSQIISSYNANLGTTHVNGLYSYGNSSDRALGFSYLSGTYFGDASVQTADRAGYLGMRIRNNTGTTITGFTINWKGEQWGDINNDNGNIIYLQYKTGATVTSLYNTVVGGGDWSNANFFTALGASSNNTMTAYSLESSLTHTITNLNLLPGQEIMLRWTTFRGSLGKVDNMAIDDVSVTASGKPTTPIALSPTNVGSTAFTMNWSAASYAESYVITISDDDLNEITKTSSSTSLELTAADGIVASKTYYYTVQSYRAPNIYSAASSNQVTTYTESNEPDYIFYGQGGTSTLWNIPANWSSGIVPTNYNSAVIAANCYVNITTAVCNNLNIDPGTMLSIGPGQKLTVNGEITEDNATSLIRVESNGVGATNTGILMHGNDGVNGIVQRYVQGSDVGELYQLVSVPINTAATPQFSQVFLWSYLAYYNETGNNWTQMNTPTNNAIYTGRGYLTSEPTTNEETYIFTGRLNNGTVNMTVSYGGAGWNLVGNPYPSTIDWNSSLGWTKTNIDNTVYVWDGANARYATYINGVGSNGGSNLIAPGQAFFVHANASGPVLSVNNVARTSTQKAFLKDETAPTDILRLTATIGELNDEMVIHFNTEATESFDRNHDAFNLTSFNGLEVPDIYSVDADNTKYAINTIPFNGDEKVIDVIFKYGSNGLASIKATDLESFNIQNPDLDIFLEDKLTGVTTNLRSTPEYTFEFSSSDDPARFRIHMGNTLGITKTEVTESKCRAYAVNGELYLKYEEFANQPGTARIFDTQGRLLTTIDLDKSGSQNQAFTSPAGVYFVKFTFSQYTETEKIAIR